MPKVPFADLAEVNPRRRMKRGERYPFIEMAAVPEGGGHPTRHGEREFNGSGSKFALGDTLFARITPLYGEWEARLCGLAPNWHRRIRLHRTDSPGRPTRKG